MTNRTIRVGFVGAGANTRRHHIPKLRAQPDVELVAVANRTKDSGERVARAEDRLAPLRQHPEHHDDHRAGEQPEPGE